MYSNIYAVLIFTGSVAYTGLNPLGMVFAPLRGKNHANPCGVRGHYPFLNLLPKFMVR
jgi:hypothetical protein